MGKLRRNRRRWDIQQGRKLRRRGVCPCSDVRIDRPGPHLDACEWAGEGDGPCWCGEPNPVHFGLPTSCGGSGSLRCECGGDGLCVCHNHGEVDCMGCPDCEGEIDEGWEDYEEELDEDDGDGNAWGWGDGHIGGDRG